MDAKSIVSRMSDIKLTSEQFCGITKQGVTQADRKLFIPKKVPFIMMTLSSFLLGGILIKSKLHECITIYGRCNYIQATK